MYLIPKNFFFRFSFLLFLVGSLTVVQGIYYSLKHNNNTRRFFSQKCEDKALAITVKKHPFRMVAYGGGGVYNLHTLIYWFELPVPVSLPELRRILLDTIDVFVTVFNDEPGLYRYLSNVPFMSKNMEITVSFPIATSAGKFFSVVIVDDVLYYRYLFESGHKSVIFFEESYEEAVEKNQEYLQKLPHPPTQRRFGNISSLFRSAWWQKLRRYLAY